MDELSQLLGPLDRIHGGCEGDIARRLLSFLDTYRDTTHVTIQLVRQLTPDIKVSGVDAAILRTLQFLAGDGVQCLETRFELIEPDHEPIELSDDDVATVMSDGTHPITGEVSVDIKDQVFLYFRPTINVAKLKLRALAAESNKGLT